MVKKRVRNAVLGCNLKNDTDLIQCSCLENPRDGGAWWEAIYRVSQSQTRLKRFSSSSSRSKRLEENSDKDSGLVKSFLFLFRWLDQLWNHSCRITLAWPSYFLANVCLLALFTFCSVQFSCSVMSDSLQSHEPQHARPSCPSPTPGVHPNLCPLSQWCHPTISSSVVPFSSCPQSFSASGSFPMS